MVVVPNVYDAWFGSDYQQVDTVQIEGGDATDALDTSVATVFTTVVENSKTFIQFLRIMKAALAGKTTNGGTRFRDDADTKDRIQATIDGSKNRTAMVLDGS